MMFGVVPEVASAFGKRRHIRIRVSANDESKRIEQMTGLLFFRKRSLRSEVMASGSKFDRPN